MIEDELMYPEEAGLTPETTSQQPFRFVDPSLPSASSSMPSQLSLSLSKARTRPPRITLVYPEIEPSQTQHQDAKMDQLTLAMNLRFYIADHPAPHPSWTGESNRSYGGAESSRFSSPEDADRLNGAMANITMEVLNSQPDQSGFKRGIQSYPKPRGSKDALHSTRDAYWRPTAYSHGRSPSVEEVSASTSNVPNKTAAGHHHHETAGKGKRKQLIVDSDSEPEPLTKRAKASHAEPAEDRQGLEKKGTHQLKLMATNWRNELAACGFIVNKTGLDVKVRSPLI